MIVHDRRAIFVHIQKTGGNSICKALSQNPDCPEKHFAARELRTLYGVDVWDAYFKFAFVRNPWDRLVSWWAMIDGHRAAFANGMALNNFQRFVLTRAATFQEFLENCGQEIVDSDGPKWIYRNQIDYLTDAPGSDRLIVDFVGRFETLQQDFDLIARRHLGGPLPLSHDNRSEHRRYTEFYTPALADKVAKRYQRDIEAFGYAFGQ